MTHQEIGSTYREIGAAGADQIELVVLLYGALIDDLRRGIQAIKVRNIETRTSELQHALRILEQLQGSLNMEEGGEVAKNLEQLYSIVRGKIIEAQWKVSEEILQSQIELLSPVRDAWRLASGHRRVQESVAHVPVAPAEVTFECRT
jgi:flagellar protein FliS